MKDHAVVELIAHAICLHPHSSIRVWAVRWLSSPAGRYNDWIAVDARRCAIFYAGGSRSIAFCITDAAKQYAWAVEARHPSTYLDEAVERITPAICAGEPAIKDRALDRARAILAGEFPAEQFDAPY